MSVFALLGRVERLDNGWLRNPRRSSFPATHHNKSQTQQLSVAHVRPVSGAWALTLVLLGDVCSVAGLALANVVGA